MIGDRVDTDIAVGQNTGMDTLLVYTGVYTKEMMTNYSGDVVPTYSVDNLALGEQ